MPPAGGSVAPASAPAVLTGRGGRISPTLVEVPPYIAVQVTLVSADGASYTVHVAGKTLRVGGTRGSQAQLTLDGLRPGAGYVAEPEGGGRAVRIEPSAEPGA
ncbi:MAG: hypothetical protein NVSMB25_23100 [Thermoleophilaceae bacterium]